MTTATTPAVFFSGVNIGRRNILESAGNFFSSLITDNLAAITPGGGNTWSAEFFHPSASGTVTIPNLVVPGNTLTVFVGAKNLGASLGQGGPGGFSVSGTTAWIDTVVGRGQPGALGSPATQTDFAPWGGMLTFNSQETSYFDSDPTTLETFPGQSDFYSVALHELAHILGYGNAYSWGNLISGGNFMGNASVAAFGGLVPLDSAGNHWADGLTSTVYGTSVMQEAAMTPALLVGTRKHFTTLDMAGLQDIGWQVIPEPATWILFLAGACLLVWCRRARAGCAAEPPMAEFAGSLPAHRGKRVMVCGLSPAGLREILWGRQSVDTNEIPFSTISRNHETRKDIAASFYLKRVLAAVLKRTPRGDVRLVRGLPAFGAAC